MAKNKLFILRHPRLTLITLGIVVVAIAVALLARCSRHNSLQIVTDQGIDATPQIVESLKAIGQWEFLSVTDEEMVDTVRKGFFSDDQLARIYYGRLHLGIDMSKTDDGWISSEGDSVSIVLPPIQLLDSNFIDETRTKAFIEKGTWTDADRQRLYEKARRQMLGRCLTKSNLKSAEDNATRQFNEMMKQMGFNKIRIRIKER